MPASAKSNPVAPFVTTTVDPSNPLVLKVKTMEITELVVPMFTAPNIPDEGAFISTPLTVKARVMVIV